MKKYQTAVALIWLFTLASLLFSVWATSGLRADTATFDNITAISSGIQSYVDSKRRLPNELGDISLDDEVKKRLSNYTYEVIDKSHYKLCATFKKAKGSPGSDTASSSYPTDRHSAGYYCYSLESYGASEWDNENPAPNE